MENSSKKPILIGIVVVCLALAIGITYFRTVAGPNVGPGSLPSGQMIWVKCANPNCGAEYEMDKKEYYQLGEQSPTKTVSCKQCNEPSLFQAIKCEKCGIVFIPGSVPADIRDRCPECGYSKEEGTTKDVKSSQ